MKCWRFYSVLIVLVFTLYSCISPMSSYFAKTKSLATYEAELNRQNIPAETKSRLYWSMAKQEFPEYSSFIDNVLLIELAVVNKPEKTLDDLVALNKMKTDFWIMVGQDVRVQQETYNKNINDVLMWTSSIVYNASKAYIESQAIKYSSKSKQDENDTQHKPSQVKPQPKEIKLRQ